MGKMDGKWIITVDTYMGDMVAELEATTENDVLAGVATDKGNGAKAELFDTTLNGNDFSYKITIKTPVGELTNELKGHYDESKDELEGTSANPMGEFQFKGVRCD